LEKQRVAQARKAGGLLSAWLLAAIGKSLSISTRSGGPCLIAFVVQMWRKLNPFNLLIDSAWRERSLIAFDPKPMLTALQPISADVCQHNQSRKSCFRQLGNNRPKN
jgi:hypothetical protein